MSSATDFHKYKNFISLPDEIIKQDFEEIVNHQKECKKNIVNSMETFTVSIFQDIYANEIQKAVYSPYHSHDYYEINYIYSGKCYEYIDGKLFTLKKGDIMIMSPSTTHSCYLIPQGIGRNILIKKRLFDKIASEISTIDSNNFMRALQNKASYFLFRGKQNTFLVALFDELFKYSYTSLKTGTTNYMKVEKIVNLTFHELYNSMLDGQIEYSTDIKFKKSNNTFEDITNYIKNNLSTITREKVETHFGYSSMSLYRVMQSNGTTFKEHLTAIRQREAVYLLKHTNYTITEISKALGFESNEYFCRFFKKYRNMSPSEYRKNFLENGGVDNQRNL